MNAVTRIAPTARTAFTGWISDGASKAHRTDLLGATLIEIERTIAKTSPHGATVFVLEHDTVSGSKTVHAYRIRRGKWLGGLDPDTHAKVYPHTADKLFSLQVTAFEPLEPWRWAPGADVVGHDHQLIEGEAA